MKSVDPQRYGRTYELDDQENWQEAGFLWEHLLSGLLASRIAETAVRFRPGEIVKDGIICSPDAFCVEADGSIVVEEFKLTWKSSKKFDLYDKRFLNWLLQIMAYLYAADALVARLYVFHINGNYERFVPAVAAYRLEFSQRERDDNWRSLVNTAKSRGMLK